jgi:hypothetical protein
LSSAFNNGHIARPGAVFLDFAMMHWFEEVIQLILVWCKRIRNVKHAMAFGLADGDSICRVTPVIVVNPYPVLPGSSMLVQKILTFRI